MADIKTFSLTLMQKISLTHNVREFRFSKPPGFTYKAGQFLQIAVPDGETKIHRAFSISNKPLDTFIELCVKILPEGKASSLLESLIPGDTIDIRGPFGKFTSPDPAIPLMCVATGVGIAPLAGILQDELEVNKNSLPIHLLFGVRHETDIFWLERFETLARDYSNFTYTITLSAPGESWDAHRGRVTEHLKTPKTECSYFLCGNIGMVKDVKHLLTTNKVSEKNIRFEIF